MKDLEKGVVATAHKTASKLQLIRYKAEVVSSFAKVLALAGDEETLDQVITVMKTSAGLIENKIQVVKESLLETVAEGGSK